MRTVLASLLILFSSHAFAGTNSFSAAEIFDLSSSTADADCSGIASVLSQISSANLSVSIDENCLLNKHHGFFLRNLARVFIDLGSWGVNEIACKTDHYGPGCDDSTDYLSLHATFVAPKSDVSSFQGNPVAMSASDCQLYTQALSKLRLSNHVKLTTTCTDGTLQTSFNVSE